MLGQPKTVVDIFKSKTKDTWGPPSVTYVLGKCCVAGVVHVCGVELIVSHLQGDCYILDETFVSSLSAKKQEIRAARKMTSSILGWDVPFSTLKFTEALGTCKYGEVFKGMMDETEIVVKTLKPDGGEMSRESFDRELDLL